MNHIQWQKSSPRIDGQDKMDSTFYCVHGFAFKLGVFFFVFLILFLAYLF